MIQRSINNYKTTIAGIASIGLGIWLMTRGEKAAGIGLITTGLGLLHASDAKSTPPTK